MLGFTVEVAHWLAADQQQRSPSARHQRDRQLATELGVATADLSPARQVQMLVDWWRALGEQPGALAAQGIPAAPASDSTPDTAAALAPALSGRNIERVRLLISVLLLVLGALLGSGLAAAALRYDGSAPVNLVSAVGLLVLLPGILLLFTLLLLPGRVPFAGWLQDIVATLNPGQWASSWLSSRFAGLDLGWKSQRPRYVGDTDAALDLPGMRRLAKWQMLVYSQQLAIGYAAGALATLIGLITFSDMAFGWSTTLDLAPARVSRWVELLSTPWAALWPAAAPTAELVEASRFFRAAGVSASDAQQLGDWWPFLLMLLLCYSLLPRLGLFWLARTRLRAAEQHLLLDNTAVQRLLQRMTTPLAEHLRPPPEEPSLVPADAAPVRPGTDAPRIALAAGETVALFTWNNALAPSQLGDWLPGHTPSALLELGSATPMAAEEALLLQQPALDLALVFAKSWEPPLLELQDFLLRLATRLTPVGRVLVVPVGIDGALPKAADLAIWQQTLGLIDDVRLRVWSAP